MLHFRDSSIPLYYQLESILREKISSGEFRAGAPFPTEDQLSQEYQVSRITVRKALSSLEKDGLISRRRGKGSFVTDGHDTLEPMKLTGTIEDIVAMGIKTQTKVLHFGFVHPPVKVAKQLRLGEGAQVLRIERIRLTKEGSFSYNINYIPPDLGKKIKAKDLLLQPVLNILEEKCRVRIGKGSQIIDATVADARVASLLEVRTGDPLLRIERSVFDVKGRPVEYMTIYYRSDRYHYSVDLVRKRSPSRRRWDLTKPKIRGRGRSS